MPNDQWSQYAVPTATPSTQPTQPSGTDPWAQYAAQPTKQSAEQTPALPSPASDPWSQYSTASTKQIQEANPEHDESDRFTQDDPGANWLEKGWTMANKPLTESLFGWGHYRHGAGGIERFAEKTLSGLTAPLNLATLAVFAPAGLAEGVAGSALKEGLVEGADFLGGEALSAANAASKVEKFGEAVGLAKKAQMSGANIESAVSSVMPYQEYVNYGQYLRNLGMKETDLLGESFLRRGVSQGLSKVGVGPAQALTVAKGVETAVNAGFSFQAVHGAMYAYPRALDQMENGDYDGAMESILEAGTNTLFGSLGLAHSLHSIQDLVPSINEKNNLPLTQEVEDMKKIFGMNEGQVAKTQFDIEQRRREHVGELFELAGLPQYAEAFKKIPEGEKYNWGAEIGQAFRNILVNQGHREALAQKQMEFFAALDSGMKADLASQKIAALVESYKLHEWAKAENLPDAMREQRTIGTIADEESRNILTSKADMNDSMAKIRAHEMELKNLHETLQDPDTPPQEKAIAQKQIETVNNMLNEQKAGLPGLQDEYYRNVKWDAIKERLGVYEGWMKQLGDEVKKDPNNAELATENQRRIEALRFRIARQYEPLYREKYDELNQKLNEAAKDINPAAPFDRNALEEFNKKVRIMGVNPQDIETIEEAFPQFRNQPPTPIGEYLADKREYPLPATTSDRAEMVKRVSQIDREMLPFNRVLNDFVRKGLDLRGQGKSAEEVRSIIANDPRYLEIQESYNKLALEQRRLEQALEKNLPSQYQGEVHSLPDGKRVLWLTSEAMQDIQNSFGKDGLPAGQQIPAKLTQMVVDHLRKHNIMLAELINRAKNEAGDVVLSLVPGSHGGVLSTKVWTLREELAHQWQGSLAKTNSLAHLSEDQYAELGKQLPPDHVDYLKKVGYNTEDTPVTVLEAAAKMMSVKNLSDINVTPEEASDFLNKYFTEIKNRHGGKALDSLMHITAFAKKIKDDFASKANEAWIQSFSLPDEAELAMTRPQNEQPLSNRHYPEPLTAEEKQAQAAHVVKLKSQIEKQEQLLDTVGEKHHQKEPSDDYLTKLVLDLVNENPKNYEPQELQYIKSDPLAYIEAFPDRIQNALDEDGYKGWKVRSNHVYFDNRETPEYKSAQQRLTKLWNQLDRAQFLEKKGVREGYMGEVHKLSDGQKVLWVTQEANEKLKKLLGTGGYAGMHLSKGNVDLALRKLESYKHPNMELYNLLTKARNAEGDIALSLTPGAGHGKLSRQIHTVREELNHGWQGSLAKTNAFNHLTQEQYNSLRQELTPGFVTYMKQHRVYNTKDNASMVLEAAAKMLSAKDLSTIGVTPEEAAGFLHKYFTEIRKTHGDNALDSLTHITKYGKELKEKFIRSYREPEPTPGPGESEEALSGVGEGGGGGNTETPTGGGGGGEPPDPEWRRKFPLEGGQGYTAGFQIPAWLNQPLHPALPDNIEEMVEKAKGKVHTPEQVEYVQKYIRALAKVARKDFTPREMEFYKSLRKADDDNWDVGYNKGIIHSIVDNHIHHIWGEDPRKGYATTQKAGSGAFAINASQARHRSWTTAFEGILGGRKLAVHDPTSIIAHDANNIAVAAGHREIVDAIINSKLKGPDGMPLAVPLGMGIEVKGEDGSPAKEIVNPNIVRKIQMSEPEIQRLKDAGLLDRYIKDGLVTDRTPQVEQHNVKGWIKSTQQKLDELVNKNPLLANPKDRIRHEAGWGQLENFAKEQAGKIAAYMHEALKQSQASGDSTVPEGNKAAYGINMADTYNKLLHGLNGRMKLLPQDIQRLQQYLERVENHAAGMNGKGTGSMTPADVARYIMQEKDHLDPELTAYVNEHHDLFAPRDDKGNIIDPANWKRKTMSTAMYHVAHAALNKEYPQLIQDMDDLNYVDKNLTSVNPITQQLHKEDALKRLEDINARQPKQYLWSPKGYITIDHPAFHDYKWMATAPDGTSVLASSKVAVHPEVYDYLINRLGLNRSALREPKALGRVTAPLLNLGAKAKYAILSGSPFHVIQEGLRAAMLWTNPFVRPNPVENIDAAVNTVRGPLPLIRLGVENSLNIFNNRFMAEDAAVGVAQGLHSASLEKVPGLKQWLRWSDQVHHFLFDRYIPSLKSNGFQRMFNKYAESHPDWTNDAVAYAAAQHVNNAFGGINWREMGRSATTQDWFHLFALAPDWLESEMRFASQLFNNWGIGASRYNPESGHNHTRNQVVGMAAAMWSAARVLNLLYSGNAHFETPFGLATKDKDGREIEFSVRTMPTDILHMASDPMGFLNGRMSPMLREEEELRTGRNQFGQKLTPGEKAVDMISNVIPIPYQQTIKKVTGLSTAADVPIGAQVAKGFGATAYVYRTPAEKTAANLAAERSEEGSMNPAKVARHRLLLQLEDDLRSSRINNDDLEEMVTKGNLPIADAKKVVKNVQETVGQDSETARLYSRVTRLDFEGAMAVWNDANPKERKLLEKLIIKKAASYIKKSITDHTPDERVKDPMFHRALEIAPMLEKEEAPTR